MNKLKSLVRGNSVLIGLAVSLMLLCCFMLRLNIMNVYNIIIFLMCFVGLSIISKIKKSKFITECLVMLILVVFIQTMVTDADSFFTILKYPLVILIDYVDGFEVTDMRHLYNFFIWFSMILIIKVLLSNKPRIANVGLLTFSLLIALINEYLIIFRGSAFSMQDFSGIRTAMEVVGQYNFSITLKIGLLLLFYCWSLIYILKFDKIILEKKERKYYIVIGVLLNVIIYLTPLDSIIGVNVFCSEPNGGFMTTLVINMKNHRLSEPDDYEQSIAYLSQNYISEESQDIDLTKPNIVVIMNESYADLRLLTDENLFEDSQDPYEMFDEITAQSISGYVNVSVFGGTTANSEFEFLTGSSMAFRTDVPYATSLSADLPEGETQAGALVTYFESLGYKSIAFHPYDISGWHRESTYTNLGFDEMYFINDLNYEDEDYLRSYVSDEANYQTILDLLSANEDESIFLFNVTMQNHGGYETGYEFDTMISITGVEGEYPKAEEFLSLVYESNIALTNFLSELQTLEQETIVVFFGDHAPKLDDEFYEWVSGSAFDSSNADNYVTPYFIWSSKETLEGSSQTSLNFLQLELISVLDTPKTAFQILLEDVQSEYPIISSHLLIDSNNEVQDINTAMESSVILQLYEAASYNQLEENGSLLEEFFVLLD
ncbi:MAG: LTA synthase family protein [Erysipelotrichaceae bacterium]